MTLIDKACFERGCACYDSRDKGECVEITEKREWVGLTDEERSKIWGELPPVGNEERDACIFAECIELYLKEKNT